MNALVSIIEATIKALITEYLRFHGVSFGARKLKVDFKVAGGYTVRVLGSVAVTKNKEVN